MTIMTSELRLAIEQAGNQPARVLDPETNVSYVLVREDEYQKIRDASESDPPESVEDLYQLSQEAFGKTGWDDPKMDDYDNYEVHRP